MYRCSIPAGTKDDLVRPEAGLSADQGHVDEYLGMQQRLERL